MVTSVLPSEINSKKKLNHFWTVTGDEEGEEIKRWERFEGPRRNGFKINAAFDR